MLRVLMAIVALVSVLPGSGCRRETNPPPQFVGRGSSRGVPVRVYGRVVDRDTGQLRSRAIIAAAPAEDQAPRSRDEEPAARSPDAVAGLDDSTPEGVVKAYVEAIGSAQFDQLVAILVPEQQEPARKVISMMRPVLDAQRELERAWESSFPGHAIQLDQAGGPSAMLEFVKQFTVVEIRVDPDDEDAAEATLQAGDDLEELALTLERIDGRWRVRDPKVPDSEQELAMIAPMAEMFTKLADAQKDIASRIENGDFDEPEAARKALAEAMAKAVGMDQMVAAMAQAGEEMGKDLAEGMAEAMAAGFAAGESQGMDLTAEDGQSPVTAEGSEKPDALDDNPAANDPNAALYWEVYEGFESLHEELETFREHLATARDRNAAPTVRDGEETQLAKDFPSRLRQLRRQVAKPEPGTAAFHLDAAGEQIYVMAGSVKARPEAYEAAQQAYEEAMDEARALMGEPPGGEDGEDGPGSSDAAPAGWPSALSATARKAEQEGKPVLLVFVTEWCAVCKSMDAQVFPQPNVKTALADWIMLKVDAERKRDLSSHYKIRAFPTLIALTAEGEEINRKVGGLDAAGFIQWLAEAAEQDHKPAGTRRSAADAADDAAEPATGPRARPAAPRGVPAPESSRGRQAEAVDEVYSGPGQLRHR